MYILSIQIHNPIIVDLFCGAGGFSSGFVEKSSKMIGVDKEPVFLETYRENIHGETIECLMEDFDPSVIGHCDILIGSPPCPEHSYANRHRTHDPSLIKRYFEIRDFLKPKIWILENVPGAVETGLFKDGEIRYLRACDFGLPHVRKRLFAGNYPEPRASPYVGKVWTSKDGRHSTMYVPTPMTGGIQVFKYDRERGYPCGENFDFLYGGSKSPALVAGLMGFPESYIFHGTVAQQYEQIGNAVCPPISRALWMVIKNPPKNVFDFATKKVKD